MRVINWCGVLGLFIALGGMSSAVTLTEQGIMAFREGRYSEAMQKLQQAVAGNSDDIQAGIFLALTQAAKNDCRTALPTLRHYLDIVDSDLARLDGLAAVKCEEATGSNAAAVAILEKLQRRFPKDADVIYTAAKLHMRAFNDATLAMFQRAPASYRVHELSAEIFEIQGQYDSATAEYQKAIAINPKAPDLHYRLGRAILMRSHDPAALKQASKEFEAERQLNPEDAPTEFQLGQIAQVESDIETARTHLERALSLSPDFPEALVALGKLETQMKQYDKAIAFLQRAISIQPANEAAHYALMMAYRDSGQLEKAKTEKTALDRLQRPPEGEFSDFLKKLGEKTPQQ
jgi:tetratricopeptide (TPR) repeat protein